MERSTFSLLFFIKKKRLLKSGEAPIYMRITINKKNTESSIKRSIIPANWDPRSGKCKGHNDKAKTLNSYLLLMTKKVYDAHMKIQESGEDVTASAVRINVEGLENRQVMLLDYYLHHNQQMKDLIEKEFSHATWKRHQTSKNNVAAFIKSEYRKADIPLSKINQSFIRKYQHYLRTIRDCNNNSTVKYIKNLGKIIRRAMSEGLIKVDPFVGIRFKLDKVEKCFLDSEELDKLKCTYIENDRIAQVRDVFVFCCYTGLAFIDVKELGTSHLFQDPDGTLWIKKKRGKTDIEAVIPVLEPAKQILADYHGIPWLRKQNRLLPVLSNQKYNAYLKEIAALCGINKELTTHTARHTFATTVTMAEGISLEVVSKMLGHTTIVMTQQYAKMLPARIKHEMTQLASWSL